MSGICFGRPRNPYSFASGVEPTKLIWFLILYKNLTDLIFYLRLQKIMVSEIKLEDMKVSDNCWKPMCSVSHWSKKNTIKLNGHLSENNPECLPTLVCWMKLLIIVKLFSNSTITLKSLQVHRLTVYSQRHNIQTLQVTFLRVIDSHNLMEHEAASLGASLWVL